KEGSHLNHPFVNQEIGALVISGRSLNNHISDDADIDLEFHVDESQEIRVKAYISDIGQEFLDVFSPKQKNVDLDWLKNEIVLLAEQLDFASKGDIRLVDPELEKAKQS